MALADLQIIEEWTLSLGGGLYSSLILTCALTVNKKAQVFYCLNKDCSCPLLFMAITLGQVIISAIFCNWLMIQNHPSYCTV